VKPLSTVPAFGEALLWFQNPLLGVLAGALFTAILQSSSASIGILQALAGAGQLTVGATIPIIMGQNIGTCVTTLISSVGANRNAKRTAMIHLYFNVIGTALLLGAFSLLRATVRLSFINDTVTAFQIALIHTLFNLLCTALLFPLAPWLERLAVRTVPGKENEKEEHAFLDERLLTSPSLAVAQSHAVCKDMAVRALSNARMSFALLQIYDQNQHAEIEKSEGEIDRMEDEIGNYLVSIGSKNMSEKDSFEVTSQLHLINDLERISDHALNLAQAAEQATASHPPFSEGAKQDLQVLCNALEEILWLTERAFCHGESDAAWQIEPLEQVIDKLEEEARQQGVERLRNNGCSIESGFLFSDMLGDLERIADHCSNVAQLCLATREQSFRTHESLQNRRNAAGADFDRLYEMYRSKFSIS
ncbi:MAG: Na/Pi cotransporter family protein, partial [Clostridia bacterium]|nr:Na/Pi cotransporter family protein [Clostridia bacterium]